MAPSFLEGIAGQLHTGEALLGNPRIVLDESLSDSFTPNLTLHQISGQPVIQTRTYCPHLFYWKRQKAHYEVQARFSR